jgi:hypothetical protein
MAKRMLGLDEEMADASDMIGDVMGEIVNVLGGGLKTAIDEYLPDCVLGLPHVQEKITGALAPLPESASVLHFVVGGDVQFSLTLILNEGGCVCTHSL